MPRLEDVRCPYCNKYQAVWHDDGFGYEEDVRHEGLCEDCGKAYVFMTEITFSYRASKADCLNDTEHKLGPTHTSPIRMACEDCEYIRAPTTEEMKAIKKL